MIGIIAHELAHVFLRHDPTTNRLKAEEEADGLASEWGFSREIKEVRRKTGPPTNGRKNFRRSNIDAQRSHKYVFPAPGSLISRV